MKRILLTYLSLVLILSSVFLTPLSVIASEVTTDDLNTETVTTSTSDDTENDVKENADDESTTKGNSTDSTNEAEEELDTNIEGTEIQQETEAEVESSEEYNIEKNSIDEKQEIKEITEENEVKEEKPEKKSKEEKAEIAPLANHGTQIFKFNSLKLDNKEITNEDVIEIHDGTVVELIYDWDTKGLDIKADDTAEIVLPDLFKDVTIQNIPVITDGITVGTYDIVDKVLTFTFNDQIENGNVSNGQLGLRLEFDLTKFEDEIEQEIQFNDKDNSTLTVIAKPTSLSNDISKEGHPDRTHNAQEITWSIDVMNNTDKPLTDASLKDSLPDGLGEPKNFKLIPLKTKLNGEKVISGSEQLIEPTITDNNFSYDFDKLDPYHGYRIQYTTPITDKSLTEFTNNATFNDGNKDLPAKATVSGLTVSNPIEKSGSYDKANERINWTIVANQNGNDINNLIIEDILPENNSLSLTEGSLRVEKFVNETSVGTVDINEKNFPITLGETKANEHYVVTFATDINYENVNGGNYEKISQFQNVAVLKDGDKEVARANDVVTIERDELLNKYGNPEVDYENKKVKWVLELNKAKHNLSDVTVTDTLPPGLSLSEEDITIINDKDETVDPIIKISEGVRNGDGGDFVLEFTNLGKDFVTITYVTKIEDLSIDSFSNTAHLEGEGIGDEKPEAVTPINPPATTYHKGAEAIDYNEKTMNWGLQVNPIREGIKELKIEDTFTNKGLILLPETVKVSHSSDGELTLGQDYTLEPRTEDGETGYHKGFIIKLIGDYSTLDKGYLDVKYQTSFDPQREVDGNVPDSHINEDGTAQVYVNKARFTGKTVSDHPINEDREANFNVRTDAWNSGKKEGQLVSVDSEGKVQNGWTSGNERKVAWQIYTNYQKQNLGSDVVITDTLQYNGEIDANSITVKTYTVSSDGNTTITDQVLDSSAYDVQVDGKTFTLSFNQNVSERYVVEFTTSVPDISLEKYTNTANVKVGDKEYPYEATVNYDAFNKIVDKQALNSNGSSVYIGENLDWEINLNESLSIIQNPVITDEISTGLVYVEGTMNIVTASGKNLVKDEDYTLTTSDVDGKTLLTIKLSETLKEKITMTYTTAVTAEDGDSVNNTASIEGESLEKKSVSSQKLSARQFSWVSSDYNPNRGALKVIKADSETKEPIKNNSATFNVYYELNGERVLFLENAETDQNGELNIGNLPLRTYYLVEVDAPTGYEIDNSETEIKVDKQYGQDAHVFEVTFNNTIQKTDVSVEKLWEDKNNQDGIRPETISVQLLGNGTPVGDPISLSEAADWTYTWNSVPAFESNGTEIEYTVEEVNVPTGYNSSIEKEANNITITNSYTPETIEVVVSKSWDDEDNQDGIRPDSVTVNLLNGEEIVESIDLNDSNDWTHTFTELPKFSNGEEISYSVTENTVENYSTVIDSTVTDSGLESTITNSYTPEKTTATVSKVWDDAENQDGKRPTEVTVQLLANGEELGEPVTLTETGDWTYTWEDLDLKQNGENIDYTVNEIDVTDGYEANYSNEDHGNLIITNSYEPEVTDILVNKSWEDKNNQDGIRPDSVTVNLLANGEEVKTVEISADSDWQHIFTDLPVYNNGEKITYTITENEVDGYSTTITKDEENNAFEITNTRTPDETSVTVTKNWSDSNNQDGNRPNSIFVQLNKEVDGELIPVGNEVEISNVEDWTYTWSGLDKNADGEPIKYTVVELNVDDEYTVTVDDENHGNIIITNAYTPETVEVAVIKSWDDKDNQDGIRPDSVTVNLLNGEKAVQSIDLNESNGWSYTFTDLPKFSNGEEISYSVTENTVEGYLTEIDTTKLDSGLEVVINNSYEPELTNATVTKLWNDGNNQDGNRPTEVTVQLFANDEAFDEPITLTETDSWTYTWEDLDLKKNGKNIEYTVKELDVSEEYDVEINNDDHGNLTITNNYDPKLTEVKATKVWDDADNQENDRPNNITINLLANDEKVDEIVLEESSDWQHTFTDLPVYSNGEKITYTVTENELEGYETVITDGDEENTFIITNSKSYTVDYTVKKVWDDNENKYNTRTDSIEVQLLQDGEVYGDPITLSDENNWKHTFEGLVKYDEDNKLISYTVEEISVPEGYKSTVALDKEKENTYVITNTLIPVEPEEPTGNEESEEPGNTEETEKPGKPEDSKKDPGKEDDEDKELPITGIAQNNFIAIVATLLFVAGASLLMFVRRKN